MRAKITYVKGKREYTIDGERVTKRQFDRVCRDKEAGADNLSRSDHWRNNESLSLSVHPAQVEEMRDTIKSKGIRGMTVDNQGIVHFHGYNAREEAAAKLQVGDYGHAPPEFRKREKKTHEQMSEELRPEVMRVAAELGHL